VRPRVARRHRHRRLAARRIRSGQVAINSWDMCFVQPFGGFKQSGLGREGGVEGMEAYLETKLLLSA